MTSMHIWIMSIISIVSGVVFRCASDNYSTAYRLWKRVLKVRWLYEVTFWLLLFSYIACFVLAYFFPSWWLFIFGGIWIGTIGSFFPSRYMSYKGLYDIYVTNEDFWINAIEKRKKNRIKKKRK